MSICVRKGKGRVNVDFNQKGLYSTIQLTKSPGFYFIWYKTTRPSPSYGSFSFHSFARFFFFHSIKLKLMNAKNQCSLLNHCTIQSNVCSIIHCFLALRVVLQRHHDVTFYPNHGVTRRSTHQIITHT